MQTRLDNFFKISIQNTIPEYAEVENLRTWDRHVILKSRRWPNFDIYCKYLNRSFVSMNESLVRCNYSGDDHYSKSGLCSACQLERTKGIWLPVSTEDRERPVFISFRQMRKFWNWQKE